MSSTTLSVSGVTTSTGGLKVGTAATIASNGNATFSGIVTATSFVGSGANLTGLPAGVTINTNADNRIITGSGTANTLNGESSLTFDGTKLSVSTGATVFTNGNIAAGIIILKEAGGFVDFFEEDNSHPFKKNILASNSIIHNELKDLLNKKDIE